MEVKLLQKINMITGCGHKEQIGSVYVIGEKSKMANWIVSHIFLAFVGSGFLFSVIFALAGDPKPWFGFVLTLFLFIPTTFIRLLFHDRCYRVEIDTATQRIRFFRFFYKEVVEAPIRSVTFRFSWKMTAIYDRTTVSIFHKDMVQIAEVLPEIVIEFSDGLLGCLAKKQFNKSRDK
jgi:hypothetical protein